MKDYGVVVVGKEEEEGVTVPLIYRMIHTKISDYSAIVTEKLLYCNKRDEELEAEFRFPSKNYSLFNVSYQIGTDPKIMMKVEDKKSAEQKYDDALSSGHQAYLASNVEDKVYSIKIGGLKKDEPVTIEFSYYSELDISEKSLNFRVPVTLIPPYVAKEDEFDPKKLPLFSFNGLPYGVYFSASVDRSDGFDSSVYGLDPSGGAKKFNSMNAENSHRSTVQQVQIDGNRDISFRIVPQNPIKSSCQFYTDNDGNQYLQTTFCNYPKPSLEKQSPQKAHRFVFVIDGSGSMGGQSIQHAKQAAKLALQELPVGCQFTLAMFGSNFKFYEEDTWLNYDEESRNKGHEWINQNCNSNYGGTEMFNVLDEAYKRLVGSGENYNNNVILLTDGAIYNQNPIYELVKKCNELVSIYALGIGNGHDSTFLDKCVGLGRGVSKHVYNNEEIEESVQYLLKTILKPTIRDIQLEFVNCESDDGLSYKRDVLFFNEPWTTYAKIKNVTGEPQVRLVCDYGTSKTLVDAVVPPMGSGSVMVLPEISSRSYATAKIKQVMDNKDLTDSKMEEIVMPLALKYDIVTRWTSAVAVREMESDGKKILEKVEIPISKPAEFGEYGIDSLECASVGLKSMNMANSAAFCSILPMSAGTRSMNNAINISSNMKRSAGIVPQSMATTDRGGYDRRGDRGINTVGSSFGKNASYDIKGTPPAVQTGISNWQQTSVAPDTTIKQIKSIKELVDELIFAQRIERTRKIVGNSSGFGFLLETS
jgi:Ca-activated chloride channel family protein